MHNSRKSVLIAFVVLALPALMALVPHSRPVPPIRPQIPDADRSSGNRVFLEQADFLRKNPGDTFLTVVNNVIFTKGPMIMKCDSAHFFESSESLQAFGNVSMEQGDTLFVYADELTMTASPRLQPSMPTPARKCALSTAM